MDIDHGKLRYEAASRKEAAWKIIDEIIEAEIMPLIYKSFVEMLDCGYVVISFSAVSLVVGSSVKNISNIVLNAFEEKGGKARHLGTYGDRAIQSALIHRIENILKSKGYYTRSLIERENVDDCYITHIEVNLTKEVILTKGNYFVQDVKV